MKTKNIFCLLLLAGVALGISSCTKFLDEMPDNRTELDSEDKVLDMLVYAYPTSEYQMTCEFSSDNVDETAVTNPDFSPLQEQLYRWEDVQETDNSSPSDLWSGLYTAIAAANEALKAIDAAPVPLSTKMSAARGEALVARAYAHFMLVNVFCQAYNPQYSATDLGIPYMEKAETTLNPKYSRGTVADVYAKIEQDLIVGVPLINDVVYSIPKYHFNQKAANAFAARFYLFYQKWDKAIEHANAALGPNPETQVRDMAYMASLPEKSADKKRTLKSMEYINAMRKCNLMMLTAISEIGICFGGYASYTGFTPTSYLNATETFSARPTPWGAGGTNWYVLPATYSNPSVDKTVMWRAVYLFEYKDPVNNIGYPHSVYPAFTIEETLLNRAEAYIMKKEYAPALNDMNLWTKVYVAIGASQLTEASVNTWANSLAFYDPFKPTIKKRIEAPAFEVAGGSQENMCYALLHMRRLEFLHMGLRWFDVKRYGITISHRKLASTSSVGTVTGVLKPRDPRCAIQIPAEVVTAGLTPNPR